MGIPMNKTNRLLTITNVLLAMILVLVLVQFSPTAASANSSTIVACANKKSGALRIAYKSCKKTENRVTWSVTGPQGPAGAVGSTGSQGTPGQDRSGYATYKDANGQNIGNVITVGKDGSLYRIVNGLIWGFRPQNGTAFGAFPTYPNYLSPTCNSAYLFGTAGTNHPVTSTSVIDIWNPATGNTINRFYKAQSLTPISSVLYFEEPDGDCIVDTINTHYLPLTEVSSPASLAGPLSFSFN